MWFPQRCFGMELFDCSTLAPGHGMACEATARKQTQNWHLPPVPAFSSQSSLQEHNPVYWRSTCLPGCGREVECTAWICEPLRRPLYKDSVPCPARQPKVLAHTGTIDRCWKACKNMLPSSLSSQSPMIMTYVKAWQWRCIHRNADVCDITAKTVRKLMWWKRVSGAVATCGVGQMFISWWCL